MLTGASSRACGQDSCTCCCSPFLTPFLLIIMNSFKTTQQFFESPLSLPTTINFKNYASAFDNMDFMQGFMNSLIITGISVTIIIIFLGDDRVLVRTLQMEGEFHLLFSSCWPPWLCPSRC
ncbi:hypothetical protein ACFSQ7_15080 [Paenibacillus rhizoplanae]